MPHDKRLLAGSLLGLYAALVFVAGAYAALSYRGAAGGDDSVYYLEFAAKAFQPQHGTHLSIGPEGTSILMQGPDGQQDIHKGIHFEPVKYLTALLYFLFHSPDVLSVFYICLFFLPLLYASLIIYRGQGDILLWSVAAAYALFPASLPTSGDALRPFIALFPFLLMFFISIVYRRPAREQVLFLNLLLITREEALLFGLLGVAYLFFAGHSTRRFSMLMLGNWALWAGIAAGYVWWIRPAYEWRGARLSGLGQRGVDLLASHPLLLATGLALLCIAVVALMLRRRWLPYAGASLLATGFGMLLFAGPLFGLTESVSLLVVYGRLGMLCAVLGLIFVLALSVHLSTRSRTVLAASLGFLALLSVVVQTAGPRGLPQRFEDAAIRMDSAKLLFEVRARLSPGSPVVVDGETKVLFYDFPDTTVFQYALTAFRVADWRRFYPDSSAELQAALARKGVSVVISRTNEAALSSLARAKGMALVPVETNGRFGFYSVK